jgi:two-component system response regulator QseB
MKILLAEDDEMIGDSLSKSLKQDGYAVNWVKDGETAEIALKTETYHLLLLDIGLPKRSGIEILQKLRKNAEAIPVVIISARDSVQDVVTGLDTGADDYLVKPFELKELQARIRVAMRRKNGRADPILNHESLTLDPSTNKATYKDKTVTLSARESALMQTLLEKPEVIFSRAQLEERIYGWNEEIESNALEVHIHNLRRKLGQEVIRNVRGLGYMVGKI